MLETQTVPQTSTLFDSMSNMDHEQLVFCHDKATGLKAIVGIHNTVLGPAMGGTRMWNYATEEEAVKDVLRLSRGMTFKSAIAGLNIGGGKAVIIGDVRKIKSEALLRRFGKFINSLNGKYWTAEDVNMSTRDMEYVHMETPFVTGIPESIGGSGDPSPVTAYGVYVGMKASAKKAYGSESLKGKKVLVQGVGHVGSYLIDHLIEEGAEVLINDMCEDKIAAVTAKHKVKVVDSVYDQEMDIYAPCALGATLNDDTIPQLSCDIVAGAANNQLDNEDVHGEMLKDRGILYAPDFLINSGGIINVFYEMTGNYNRDKVYEQTEEIFNICMNVISHAEEKNVTTHSAALKIALNRIEAIGKVKLGC
ncbi:MAG: Glu/Leu/Phe/Val dehydrogenase [Cytophagales bacterium]|nr:Glu/Leu/Phe/Val dehydrogenase [Cytophagales bacterium]